MFDLELFLYDLQSTSPWTVLFLLLVVLGLGWLILDYITVRIKLSFFERAIRYTSSLVQRRPDREGE